MSERINEIIAQRERIVRDLEAILQRHGNRRLRWSAKRRWAELRAEFEDLDRELDRIAPFFKREATR